MLLNWQLVILHSNENYLEYINGRRNYAFIECMKNCWPPFRDVEHSCGQHSDNYQCYEWHGYAINRFCYIDKEYAGIRWFFLIA